MVSQACRIKVTPITSRVISPVVSAPWRVAVNLTASYSLTAFLTGPDSESLAQAADTKTPEVLTRVVPHPGQRVKKQEFGREPGLLSQDTAPEPMVTLRSNLAILCALG